MLMPKAHSRIGRIFDYLTKPVGEVRFQKAFERVCLRLRERKEGRQAGRTPERLVVRVGNRFDVVLVATIDWLEAAGDYCCLYMGKRTLLRTLMQTRLKCSMSMLQYARK